MVATNQKVTFTKAQFQILQKAFPKGVVRPGTKLEEIMFDAGRQQVLEFIKNLVDSGEYL